ncbi:MATE family efflux transporter DinF [Aeromonas dhakensis]|uniref:MATE family efflux transporter DinF n=1 Tax=Aeromonas dhakensis TaxID=196024 RepID=UPI001CEFDFF3|nr:MATE family efflux transporter DinF [Aeromonas dhakensis]MDD9306116.1 MATE family efflux transporter DinF [Aeromonas hydrophila]UCM53270.1 MATE family efflux transporter DinF [Aeromonas dhakensis]WPS55679.1 MATE family efflux transporter DinF [Aeromonas dhakensis]WRT73228.1 MATE family efflux transporter DinF [Aeromonas dhakensis]CAD7493817.1 MATE family efflux transporter [Aeromonas dhakensis]
MANSDEQRTSSGMLTPAWWRDGRRHRAVFALALPMVFSNVTTPLLGLVDTWVIGHLGQAWFLGGVSVGATLINLLFWLLGFLRMSTTGLTAQAHGASSPAGQLDTLARALGLAIALGLALLLLLLPLLPTLIALSGGSAEVQHYAAEYVSVRIWSAPAALCNLVIMGWLLGMQDARSPMLLLLFTNLVNMGLDAWFVLGLGWQVKGVAAASLLADYSALGVGLWLVSRHLRRLAASAWQGAWQRWRQWPALLRLLALNRDIFIRSLCLQLCFAFMTLQGARLGDVAVAANAVLLNFLMLISYGLDGFAYAVEAMVGRAIGRRDRQGLREAIGLNLGWALLIALGFSLLFALGGSRLIGYITDLPAVIAAANAQLPWLIAMPLLAVWCFLLDGVFIGATRAREMRNSMLVAALGGFFPVWWLCQGWGVAALWAAMAALMAGRGLTLGWLCWQMERDGRLLHSPHGAGEAQQASS